MAVIVAFVGGGCDGEYLRPDGEGVTRVRGNAKPFLDAASARSYLNGPRLLGLNRPARSVVVEAM